MQRSREESVKTDNTSVTSHTNRVSGTSLISALRQSQSPQNNASGATNLMTIQEFLLTASSEMQSPISNSPFSSSSGWSIGDPFTGPRLASFQGSSRRRSSDHLSQRETLQSTSFTSTDDVQKEIIEYTDHDFDVGNKPSNDIWEHVCSDKLWVNVLEYYYSVCTTSKERKEKCFQLKGVDIVNTPKNELAGTLLFKMKSKKTETSKIARKRKCEDCIATTDTVKTSLDSECNETTEVVQLLNELVDKVVESTCLEEKPPINKEVICSSKKEKSTRKRDASGSQHEPSKIKRFVDIETDGKTSKKLSTVGDPKWTRKHDLDLIAYMISLRKNGDSETVVCVYFYRL